MKSIEVSLIVIRSANIDRAMAFYSRLGLQFTKHSHGSGPEHYSAELGSSVFEIYPISNASSTSSTRIGFRVPSLKTCLEAFEDIQDLIVSPPKDTHWGRTAVIKDLDGHKIELSEMPNVSFSQQRKVSLSEALSRLPGPNGERFATVFEHGSLSVEVYSPRGIDPQQPHTRDEAYIVVQGSGEFVNGNSRVPFQAGDLLFAAAGEVHRFENFDNDLVVWVIFYGPEGGEVNA